MMDILELNEAQGLTAGMVRERLVKEGFLSWGCRDFDVCKYLGKHTHHGSGNSDFTVPDEWDSGPYQRKTMFRCGLELLASMRGKSTQQLLSEINPRMRKGCPSDAAVSAHGPGANWIMKDDERVIIGNFFEYKGKWLFSEGSSECSGCSFWPCDAHGNKVRWPVDERGTML